MIIGATFMACTIRKHKQQTLQGAEGYIYRLSGNEMPGPGRPAARKGKGVVREIWIYQPTTALQVQGQMPLFTQINSQLVTRTQSDSNGHYKVKLPAGKYSVFIKETKGFFAAEADGNGYLNPIEITAGQVQKRDFTITLQAFF